MADKPAVRLDHFHNISAVKFASGEFLDVILEQDGGDLNDIWMPHWSYGLYSLKGYSQNNPSSGSRLLGDKGKAKYYPYRAGSYKVNTFNNLDVFETINGYKWVGRPNASGGYLAERDYYGTSANYTDTADWHYNRMYEPGYARVTYNAKKEEKPWSDLTKNGIADWVGWDILGFVRRPLYGTQLTSSLWRHHIWVNLKNLKTIWDWDWREKGLTFGLTVHKQGFYAADPHYQPWTCRAKAIYIPNASRIYQSQHSKGTWPDGYKHDQIVFPNNYKPGAEADWGTPVTIPSGSWYPGVNYDMQTSHNWVFHLEVKTEVTGEPPNQTEKQVISLTQEYKGSQT